MSLGRILRERIIDPVRTAQGTPESIARGGALGMWVALTPTVGAQMIMCSVLAIPLRANIPVSLAMCWITNPFTLIPFYFSFYWLGTSMLGRPSEGFAVVAVRLRDMVNAVASGDEGLVDALLMLGHELLWPMVVGSMVVATLCAVPTYHGLLWFCRRKASLTPGQVLPPADVQGAEEAPEEP